MTTVWTKRRRPKYKAFEETSVLLLPFEESCLVVGPLVGPLPTWNRHLTNELNYSDRVRKPLLTNKKFKRQPVLECQ